MKIKPTISTRQAGEQLARLLDGHILQWGADYARLNDGIGLNIEVVAEACLMILENTVAIRPDLCGLIIDKMVSVRFLAEKAMEKNSNILKG
jgi:hypothetical protein